jgi:uncharacterized tellurite resistance protein B-like protein
MRHYPADSQKAAARIIALALLADGAIDPSELAMLKNRRTLDALELSEAEFEAVIHALCEDLVVYSHRVPAGHLEIGREALHEILGEVRDPHLRGRLLRSVLDIANADGELAGGEAVLIASAAECWGVDPFDAFGIETLPDSGTSIMYSITARPAESHFHGGLR